PGAVQGEPKNNGAHRAARPRSTTRSLTQSRAASGSSCPVGHPPVGGSAGLGGRIRLPDHPQRGRSAVNKSQARPSRFASASASQLYGRRRSSARLRGSAANPSPQPVITLIVSSRGRSTPDNYRQREREPNMCGKEGQPL